MNKQYEAIVVFNSDLDDAALKTQIDKINGVVTSHGGELKRQDVWGRRQLAYRINKKSSGVYCLLEFDGDSKLIADLDRQFRINEVVLRHLMVAKDKFAPDLAPGAHPDDAFAFAAAAGDEDMVSGGVVDSVQ